MLYIYNLSNVIPSMVMKLKIRYKALEKYAHFIDALIFYLTAMLNKISQWLPNTPFASISECLVS